MKIRTMSGIVNVPFSATSRSARSSNVRKMSCTLFCVTSFLDATYLTIAAFVMLRFVLRFGTLGSFFWLRLEVLTADSPIDSALQRACSGRASGSGSGRAPTM